MKNNENRTQNENGTGYKTLVRKNITPKITLYMEIYNLPLVGRDVIQTMILMCGCMNFVQGRNFRFYIYIYRVE